MKKNPLFHNSFSNRAGRRARGRLPRRDESQAAGGGTTPPAGGDNGGQATGNPLGNGNADSGTNNTGDGFDPASFWQGPQEGQGSAPSGESAGNSTPPAGNPPANPQGGTFAEQLTGQLAGLTFGEPVFNQEVAEQINNGDFTGVQKRFDSSMQAAVRQSLAMNVQILKPFAEQILAQVRQEMGQTLSGRDDTDTLVRDFPAAKNPTVAPVIRSVFDQALKNTKGNRELAVRQTKQMIALMANTTASDLDLEVAPRNPDSVRQQQTAVNWLDELSGRS